MKNLVITVSLDSSINLLQNFADIITLDNKNVTHPIEGAYDTAYIRSHFSRPSMSPQSFRSEIEALANRLIDLNPDVKFIDSMDTVDSIISFEDKWLQSRIFSMFMPRTELYNHSSNTLSFSNPVYKCRLSSRGVGVTWDKKEADDSTENWIVQESINIDEELRVYVINNEVHDVGVVRQNKTPQQKVRAISTRKLQDDEINFVLSVMNKAPDLDFVGLDIVRTSEGDLSLIEVNRSPGFAKFSELSGVNIASALYKQASSQ